MRDKVAHKFPPVISRQQCIKLETADITVKPDIGLVTENVLVPIVKPVCTVKLGDGRNCIDCPRKKTNLVKPLSYRNRTAPLFLKAQFPLEEAQEWKHEYLSKAGSKKVYRKSSILSAIEGFNVFPNSSINLGSSPGASRSGAQSEGRGTRTNTQAPVSILTFPNSIAPLNEISRLPSELSALNSRSLPNQKQNCSHRGDGEVESKCTSFDLESSTGKKETPIGPITSESPVATETEFVMIRERKTSVKHFDVESAESDSTLSAATEYDSRSVMRNTRLKEKASVDSARSIDVNVPNLEGVQLRDKIPSENLTGVGVGWKPVDSGWIDCRFDVSDVHYSWQNIDTWIPPSARLRKIEEEGDVDKRYQCKIKYSWQVVGKEAQTSKVLLEDLLRASRDEHIEGSSGDQLWKECRPKYSWQIIGTGTQTYAEDWKTIEPVFLFSFPVKSKESIMESRPCGIPRRPMSAKMSLVLNNQSTQTFAHKENQANFSEIYAESYKMTSR